MIGQPEPPMFGRKITRWLSTGDAVEYSMRVSQSTHPHTAALVRASAAWHALFLLLEARLARGDNTVEWTDWNWSVLVVQQN